MRICMELTNSIDSEDFHIWVTSQEKASVTSNFIRDPDIRSPGGGEEGGGRGVGGCGHKIMHV